jgi:hypothetical protein
MPRAKMRAEELEKEGPVGMRIACVGMWEGVIGRCGRNAHEEVIGWIAGRNLETACKNILTYDDMMRRSSSR